MSDADVLESRGQELEQRYNVRSTTDNCQVARESDLLVLSIKPQVVDEVLADLHRDGRHPKVVLSIIAGAHIHHLSEGLYNPNVIRAMRGTDNAPTIFFWFCIAGLPVVAPFALSPWPTDPGAWALAAVMGLSAFVAQVLMTEAYGALSVSEAAAWLQLTPITQTLLAWPLLGERVSPSILAGVLVGVIGVAWATVLGQRRHLPVASDPPP